VVEVADGAPSASLLREANWLVVDEESAGAAMRMATANPQLGVLALEGRGSSARLLTPLLPNFDQALPEVPNLSGLFSLFSHVAIEAAH